MRCNLNDDAMTRVFGMLCLAGHRHCQEKCEKYVEITLTINLQLCDNKKRAVSEFWSLNTYDFTFCQK